MKKEWHGKHELWIYSQLGHLGKVINIHRYSLDDFLKTMSHYDLMEMDEDMAHRLYDTLKCFKDGYAYKVVDGDSFEEWASTFKSARDIAKDQEC